MTNTKPLCNERTNERTNEQELIMILLSSNANTRLRARGLNFEYADLSNLDLSGRWCLLLLLLLLLNRIACLIIDTDATMLCLCSLLDTQASI